MIWSRAARRPGRDRRPRLEALEERQLLSISPQAPDPSPPIPAQSAGVDPGIKNASFDSLIGASAVRLQYGVDGSGLAAATIDTGADYTHPALGGQFGSGHKVEGGYDLAMNDDDPRAETWSHGTMVAGLIASDAPDASGVAPGADIVPLRVFGNDNKGSFDLIADGLQWVVDHHTELNISVVNISLSDGGNYTSDPFLFSAVDHRIRGLIDTLRGLNIPVVAASGNSFDGHSQGMGYLAILPGTISVTASDQQDHLVGDAQRLGTGPGGDAATDLAAPGSGLLAPSDNGGYARVEGTSFAAPLVSGSILLLQEIYQSRFGHLPSVSDLESWLKAGADPIHDPATGFTIGRLDIARSAALIPAAPTHANPPTDVNPSTNPPAANPPTDAPPGPPGKPVDPPSKPSKPPTEPDPAPPANPPTTPPFSSNLPENPSQNTPESQNPPSPVKPPGTPAATPGVDQDSSTAVFWNLPESSPLSWTVWGTDQAAKSSPGLVRLMSTRVARLSRIAARADSSPKVLHQDGPGTEGRLVRVEGNGHRDHRETLPTRPTATPTGPALAFRARRKLRLQARVEARH